MPAEKLQALGDVAPELVKMVDNMVSRAEQACRQVSERNEKQQKCTSEYAQGFADACKLCEKEINPHVLQHFMEDLGMHKPVN